MNTAQWIAITVAIVGATPALAQTPEVAPPLVRVLLAPLDGFASTAHLPALAQHSPFGSRPVAQAALAARRGGDRVVNDNQLKGVVADNKASNLTTGMNVISDGAFSGASGLSTVIQNSGNNVLIQNSTIVNVQVK